MRVSSARIFKVIVLDCAIIMALDLLGGKGEGRPPRAARISVGQQPEALKAAMIVATVCIYLIACWK